MQSKAQKNLKKYRYNFTPCAETSRVSAGRGGTPRAGNPGSKEDGAGRATGSYISEGVNH